jgi:peptide/nickel transport system substrate-binding protein
MYAWQFDVDPQPAMRVFCSWEISNKDNKWAGRNSNRFRNEECDRLWKAAEAEMDPVKRAAHFIRMNEIVVREGTVIPLIWRNWVSGMGTRLKNTDISGWDGNFWNLPRWYREA